MATILERAHDINMIAPKIKFDEPDVFDSWLKSKITQLDNTGSKIERRTNFIEEIIDLNISL